MTQPAGLLDWADVEAALSTLEHASGGFSAARRGVVRLRDGTRCFVKIGVDDLTKEWANREIAVYRWLERVGYPHKPRLLSYADGAFAIEDLSACDFSKTWDEPKLALTLQAMDELALCKSDDQIGIPADAWRLNIADGWQLLAEDAASRRRLSELNIKATKQQCTAFSRQTRTIQHGDIVVHADLRADNLAYDAARQRVYLVDWNWCGYGSREVDVTAFLVSVQNSGFDVVQYCPERISADAALFMAGFWLYHAVQPIWEGGNPELRTQQLNSGKMAAKWSTVKW